MAWTDSKVFRDTLWNFLAKTASFAMDLDADTFRVALYDNDITPNNDVAASASAYAAGVWTTSGTPGAEEVYETGQWAAGGVALSGVSLDHASADRVFFDATDTASGSAADLANVYGCLVYDDTLTTPVADQGLCYNYFGGANSVVNGTFTVVWHANGIVNATL